MRKEEFKKENSEHFSFSPLVILILLSLALLSLFYFYPQPEALKKAKQNIEQRSADKLIFNVGRLILLPTDETPNVATVLDKKELQGQAFFKNAENGDSVLIYVKAGKAILYRPSTNKIIGVEPIVFEKEANAPIETQGESMAKIRIAYYNGAGIPGLATETVKKVESAYSNYETGIVENASKNDYQNILVVDISGAHSKDASELASFLRGKVGELPLGEKRPDADVLIISGK